MLLYYIFGRALGNYLENGIKKSYFKKQYFVFLK